MRTPHTRSTDPRTRDRLAPLAPSAPKTHPSRSVMRADLALRPNGANDPNRLRWPKRPKSSPSPNAAVVTGLNLLELQNCAPAPHTPTQTTPSTTSPSHRPLVSQPSRTPQPGTNPQIPGSQTRARAARAHDGALLGALTPMDGRFWPRWSNYGWFESNEGVVLRTLLGLKRL